MRDVFRKPFEIVLWCLGEETDDFYEFTAEDYYRILATKKEGKFMMTLLLIFLVISRQRKCHRFCFGLNFIHDTSLQVLKISGYFNQTII